jgi:dTDP-glucose 4,6-dehydratase
MRVLLTGASGFVGSHVLRHLLANTDWKIVAPVTFRHKGLPQRISSAVCDQDWQSRVQIVHWDLRTPLDPMTLKELGHIDVIMNVASESHVDRSIEHPGSFIRNNVDVMLNVLTAAAALQPFLVLQMSTDEVYGPASAGHSHREWESMIPSNPYSASKAAQEAIAISYWRTYGVPLIITNTMNIIGEQQDTEKMLPMCIRNLRDMKEITAHVSPSGVPGSRFYLHARNLADAWLFLTRRVHTSGMVQSYAGGYTRPERYHIVGDQEINNIEMIHLIGEHMGIDHYAVDELITPVSFHESRPGHDLRYALDGSKIAALGWTAPVDFWSSLHRTIDWTLAHPEWLAL